MSTLTSRRSFLTSALLGCGALGLRAAVTGLSPAFLLDPRRAWASTVQDPAATFLLLAVSQDGESWNCNGPGSYPDPTGPGNAHLAGIDHPAQWAFALGQTVAMGAESFVVAPPWASLLNASAGPGRLGDRMCVAYHSTRAVTHAEFAAVRRIKESVRVPGDPQRRDMFASAVARGLHRRLGTHQIEPITLAPTVTTFGGRALDSISPEELQALIPLTDDQELRRLRNRAVDRIWGTLSQEGNAAQRQYFDKHVLSQAAAGQLAGSVGNLLDFDPNAEDPVKQLAAAIALFKLRLTSVACIDLPLSGDNHDDPGLQQEATFTASTLGSLQAFWEGELSQASPSGGPWADKVTFATLGTFGRTLSGRQANGRDHHGEAHATVAFGPRIQPGVVNPMVLADEVGLGSRFLFAAGDQPGIARNDLHASVARSIAGACGIPDASEGTIGTDDHCPGLDELFSSNATNVEAIFDPLA